MSNIFFMERNVRGAWVIYGRLGVRQYYGYSKKKAKEKYLEECKQKIVDSCR